MATVAEAAARMPMVKVLFIIVVGEIVESKDPYVRTWSRADVLSANPRLRWDKNAGTKGGN